MTFKIREKEYVLEYSNERKFVEIIVKELVKKETVINGFDVNKATQDVLDFLEKTIYDIENGE